jgi:hypothetical protein
MTTLVRPRLWLERRRARRDADTWIGHGFESRYPWRVAELTSPDERRLSARALRGVLAEVDGTRLPGATPLRRAALRSHLALLAELEQRLDGHEPVAARGMVAVRDLLTSPGSCLFTATPDVETCLRDVLEKLEVH